MAPNEIIYCYNKKNKIKEVLLIVTIIAIGSCLRNYGEDNLTSTILLFLLIGFLIFMISYIYLLNEHVTMEIDYISIKKKIVRTRLIPLNDIRRITIREEDERPGSEKFVMTIFEQKKNHKIIVSDLNRPNQFVDRIKEKSEGKKA